MFRSFNSFVLREEVIVERGMDTELQQRLYERPPTAVTAASSQDPSQHISQASAPEKMSVNGRPGRSWGKFSTCGSNPVRISLETACRLGLTVRTARSSDALGGNICPLHSAGV